MAAWALVSSPRARMSDLLVQEWRAWARLLKERGETHQTTNYATWNDTMYLVSARVDAVMAAAEVIGLRLGFAEIDALYRQQNDREAHARRAELLTDTTTD